jgi:hypothetical protein
LHPYKITGKIIVLENHGKISGALTNKIMT